MPQHSVAGGSDGAGHVAARIHLLVGTLRVNVEGKAPLVQGAAGVDGPGVRVAVLPRLVYGHLGERHVAGGTRATPAPALHLPAGINGG